jgi:hypothetical protein
MSRAPSTTSFRASKLRFEAAKPGLLSRSGYAFIDDSTRRSGMRRHLDRAATPGNRGPGLVFVRTYDRDYRKVLGEYAQLCGAIPMIPRYVLGPSITDLNFEYFPTPRSPAAGLENYGQATWSVKSRGCAHNHIPFDTLILDFAWHNYGWEGGYDWSPLIPIPINSRVGCIAGHQAEPQRSPGLCQHRREHSVLRRQPRARGAPGARPAAARRPSFDLDLSKRWTHATDAKDEGLSSAGTRRTRRRRLEIDPRRRRGRIKAIRAIEDRLVSGVVQLPAQLPARCI